MAMKNKIHTIGNRTHDLPAFLLQCHRFV